MRHPNISPTTSDIYAYGRRLVTLVLNEVQCALGKRVWWISRRVGLGWLIPFLLFFFFCPWGLKSFSDYYFPYSGVVVDKGCDIAWAGRYILIEDTQGRRSKKYVDPYGYAFARVGTFVVKQKGFGRYPLPPGEESPFKTLEEIKKRQKLRESQGQ